MDGPGYRQAVLEAREEFARNVPAIMSAASGVPFEARNGLLQPARGDGVFHVPLMNMPIAVTYPDGAALRMGCEAGVEITVIALHYLSRSAGQLDLDDPVRYGRLHHAAAYAEAFHTHVEVPLIRRFGSDGAGFTQAVRRVGGRPWKPSLGHHPSATVHTAAADTDALGPEPAHSDATVLWEIALLPHLPLGMRLGLAEDGLPADCVVLFPRRAGFIYAAEDLAVCGELLADHLLERPGH